MSTVEVKNTKDELIFYCIESNAGSDFFAITCKMNGNFLLQCFIASLLISWNALTT